MKLQGSQKFTTGRELREAAEKRSRPLDAIAFMAEHGIAPELAALALYGLHNGVQYAPSLKDIGFWRWKFRRKRQQGPAA